ncbi:MAG: hypothetical protein ACRDQ1_17820 [Sciscionella sp.]
MRGYYLYPALPAIGLIAMPFLPFVNTAQLWFGLPRMLVWGAICCALLTPAFLLTEKAMHRAGED